VKLANNAPSAALTRCLCCIGIITVVLTVTQVVSITAVITLTAAVAMSSFGLRRGSSSKGRTTRGESAAKAPAKLSYDPKAITGLYDKYKNVDEGVINMDGIVAFCEDLGIDPGSDVTILQLAWKFKQQTPLEFSKEEFENGMAALAIDSIAGLKTTGIPNIKAELATMARFKEFHKFCFQASREGTNRTIEKEVALTLLDMVLQDKKLFHVKEIATFLQRNRRKHITADEWGNILEFALQVDNNLGNYDEDGAWALMLDEYVEWVKDGKK